MTTEEKLQHFTMYAMEEARNKSNAMIREYTDALEKIFQEHQEKKRRQADLEIKAETVRLVRENNKRFSEEQIEIKRTMSKRQAEIKEKLFVEVRDMLARFAETREYRQMLVRQLREAIEFAGGEEIILYLDPSDAQSQYSVEAEIGAPVTVSTYSFLGGTRAVLPARNILIDNSFETRLAEAKEHFRLKGGAVHE
ncbi:MAG TPA: ATPase [Candidatus Merdisoma merdipullorum]|nr:ATPase [Candidatus Merdisoma merdipullorum]